MKFAFISEEKVAFPIAILCRVMAVSPSGYYASQRRRASQHARELLVVAAASLPPPAPPDVIVLDEEEVVSGPLSLADALMRHRGSSLGSAAAEKG